MNVKRANAQLIETSIENKYVTAILGPRRVGKSYFVEHYAQAFPERKWAFLNMDKMDQRLRVKAQGLSILISELARQHIGAPDKIWVVIDEAQKCPELFDQVKVIYDTYKDQDAIKFIMTGSAVLSLHQHSTESLAGRIELHYLQAFNLREGTLLNEPTLPTDSILDALVDPAFLDKVPEYINTLLPFKPMLEKQLAEQLLWGGFPEVLLMKSSREKINYLQNYLQTYLEKDVRSIETITDLNLYRQLLDVLAEQTGSVRDDQRMVAALGCTRDTLKKYRGYVEATLLFADIYPYIGSMLKRLVKSPKGYLLDNGFISVLTGLHDSAVLEKTGLIGHRLENWFLNELYVWGSRSPSRQSIYYWRTSSGIEVDFVVVRKPYVFPFEVTYAQEIDRKKIHNLKTFLHNEPKAAWGFYVYRGDFLIDTEHKIIFLPCWAIA